MDAVSGQYKLQEHPTLGLFLQTEPAATIAVPVNREGTIHIASLLYYHTDQPFAFYFMTDRNSEKCQLLNKQEKLQAACVVGTEKGVAFTLQMRGELTMSEPSEAVINAYYQKRGNREDDINDPDTICLKFTPKWARFTDYARGYERHHLRL